MTRRRTLTRWIAAASVAASACHHRPVVLTPTTAGVTTIANAGFVQPENIVYDSLADVYLVSNMGGGGPARDNSGFVSRVAPDGRVLTLRWIVGGRNRAQLHAPKGLAIHGDTLAVADLGAVRLFDRLTGKSLGSIAIPGLVLNDLAFAPDGSIWVTDTGPERDTSPVDTTRDLDAVWHIARDANVHAVARGLALDRPDGIVLDGTAAMITTFGSNRIEKVWDGVKTAPATIETLPAGRLDGLRRVSDGSLLVTSWDAGAVWRIWQEDEEPRRVLAGITAPAGIAVDTRRHRLAVTSMQRNELYLLALR